MKCWNPFSKGNLNVCPAREFIRKNCNFKGHFAKYENQIKKIYCKDCKWLLNSENCKYVPSQVFWNENQETCGVINAWNESSQSEVDDYSVMGVRTIYDQNGVKTKKLLKIGYGLEMSIWKYLFIRPICYTCWNEDTQTWKFILWKNEINTCTAFLRQHNQNLGKFFVKTKSKGWICEETPFFITGRQERNILGNNNLPKLGLEVRQKKCPVPICAISDPPGKSKSNKLEFLITRLFLRNLKSFSKELARHQANVKSHIFIPILNRYKLKEVQCLYIYYRE